MNRPGLIELFSKYGRVNKLNLINYAQISRAYPGFP
jgi:hypothetical protein